MKRVLRRTRWWSIDRVGHEHERLMWSAATDWTNTAKTTSQIGDKESSYAPVPLRPAVLRFIPEPPGHPGSWTGVNRVKMTFLAGKSRRSTVEALKDPGAPRCTPLHPGRAPAGPRFIPALTRFTPVLGPVLRGSPRSMPAEPGSPRFIPARWKCSINRTDL